MYSDMLILTNRFSSSKSCSTRAFASPVLPTPVGQRNMKEHLLDVELFLNQLLIPQLWCAICHRSCNFRDLARPNEKERLIGLCDRLHRVAGQYQTINVLAEAVLRSRAGLGRAQQPTCPFLFLGPIGVGKTELAMALAEQLLDDENRLVRIDMSEYMEQHAMYLSIGFIYI
ncbi:AAA domain, Cdc48 subfamily protein [Medicago truncatula]|uniref:AAA domain, Cdc48 subfamily protein n=1 Tax=Medicago truncatula TaxID=3880 RepID=G7K0L8_MEDTR|nr:AAA domain, Cdc48 subfamily protein [Medicago truncatula]